MARQGLVLVFAHDSFANAAGTSYIHGFASDEAQLPEWGTAKSVQKFFRTRGILFGPADHLVSSDPRLFEAVIRGSPGLGVSLGYFFRDDRAFLTRWVVHDDFDYR